MTAPWMSPCVPLVALRFVLALSAPLAPAAVSVGAQPKMTIYRCTDPAGNVTLQNDRACPAGHAQQIRDITTLPTQIMPSAPAPRAPAPPPAAAAAVQPTLPPASPVIVAAPQPPPALFQCRTWDDRDYLGDIADPPGTCAPLQTVGIDGSDQLGAGTACEMRRDTCTPIAADQLCRAWKRRVDEAEFRWKFAGSRNDDRKAQYERYSNVYRDSTCVR
jgi:hypothetical protein